MLTFDDETGNILIEFSDTLTVTLRPPKYGALKRLRAEREKINEAGAAARDALPKVPEINEKGTNAEKVAKAAQKRLRDIDEINLGSLEQFWRFVLLGDETFAGLADPKPPENSDEWPGALIFDLRPISINAEGQLTQDTSIIDKVFNQWGKAHWRSGPRA